MPIANMRSVTGTTIHFSPRRRSANCAAAFRERAAEERLHRAQENNRGDQQPEDRHRGEAGRERKGAFEDEEFADEAIQPGQA